MTSISLHGMLSVVNLVKCHHSEKSKKLIQTGLHNAKKYGLSIEKIYWWRHDVHEDEPRQ